MADEPDGTGAARARLVDQLRRSGRLTDPAVEAAFLAVPRHAFLPQIPAGAAYLDEAVVIKTGGDGLPVSSSSQPAIMAIMLEQLAIAPGQSVLEVGTGTGYNAALMSHLAGDRGIVVTVDIDEDLVARARANLAAAGYATRAIVVRGDGGFGVPGYAPYDRLIVTAGAWDLAPAWLAQLRPGGRIVLPLSVRGIQLCMALEREAGHWRSRAACRCGFIRLAGRYASPEAFAPVGPQPGLHVQADDGRPLPADALYAALAGPVTDVPAGVRVDGPGQFGDADIWVTLTEPGLTRLTIIGQGPSRGEALPLLPCGALADRGGGAGAGEIAVACILPAVPPPGPAGGQEDGGFEVAVRGYGPGGAGLASRLAGRLMAWQGLGRPGEAGLSLLAYPAAAAEAVPPGYVQIDRPHTRLAVGWPGPPP